MKKSASVQWILTLLLISALVWWTGISILDAAAIGAQADAPVPSKDPAVIEAVKKVEGPDMGDAMVALDTEKLNQIFGDDWAAIGESGRMMTKEKLLQNVNSGKDRLVSYKIGPIDVQVFGDVAVAHGAVAEKRIQDGKDHSSKSVWMDLLERRAGKWVVVRSASADVK
jgi:hypothetical protein